MHERSLTLCHESAEVPGKRVALQDMTSKIFIEKIVLNPQVADSRFTIPEGEELKVREARKVGGSLS
jgi:hypothetical protein